MLLQFDDKNKVSALLLNRKNFHSAVKRGVLLLRFAAKKTSSRLNKHKKKYILQEYKRRLRARNRKNEREKRFSISIIENEQAFQLDTFNNGTQTVRRKSSNQFIFYYEPCYCRVFSIKVSDFALGTPRALPSLRHAMCLCIYDYVCIKWCGIYQKFQMNGFEPILGTKSAQE